MAKVFQTFSAENFNSGSDLVLAHNQKYGFMSSVNAVLVEQDGFTFHTKPILNSTRAFTFVGIDAVDEASFSFFSRVRAGLAVINFTSKESFIDNIGTSVQNAGSRLPSILFFINNNMDAISLMNSRYTATTGINRSLQVIETANLDSPLSNFDIVHFDVNIKLIDEFSTNVILYVRGAKLMDVTFDRQVSSLPGRSLHELSAVLLDIAGVADLVVYNPKELPFPAGRLKIENLNVNAGELNIAPIDSGTAFPTNRESDVVFGLVDTLPENSIAARLLVRSTVEGNEDPTEYSITVDYPNSETDLFENLQANGAEANFERSFLSFSDANLQNAQFSVRTTPPE